MYFDSENVLENKLILLYAFNQCKAPLTKDQISQIIIENIQISYFDIHFLLDSLMDDGFLVQGSSRNNHVYSISEKGRESLNLFIDRIPSYIREMLDMYVCKNKDNVLKDVRCDASYHLRGDGDFAVQMSLVENDVVLMDISIHVPNVTQAKHLCQNWKSGSSRIYSEIIQALVRDDHK